MVLFLVLGTGLGLQPVKRYFSVLLKVLKRYWLKTKKVLEYQKVLKAVPFYIRLNAANAPFFLFSTFWY